jgi:nucleoside-diphosphate-sugar epimerase
MQVKVFVTGATGFAGSHLTVRLLERGYQVVGLDIKKGNHFDKLQEKGAQLHIGSVTDPELVDHLTAGCDRVFHLAAAFRKVNLPKSNYWDVNVNGTRHVLTAAKKHRVPRVLHCSTCGVHGNVTSIPAAEDAPIAPADWYQETKWQGELVCREFTEEGLWITTVRPTAIYGPGDPQRFAMLFRRIATGRFFMIGTGDTHYHPVYVSNLVDAMEQMIEADVARGKAYLIGDESSIAIKNLINEIAKVLSKNVRLIHIPYWPAYLAAVACEIIYKPFPAEPPIFPRRVDWFIQNRSFDIRRAKQDFGYHPTVDLSTGLTRTGEWCVQEGII